MKRIATLFILAASILPVIQVQAQAQEEAKTRQGIEVQKKTQASDFGTHRTTVKPDVKVSTVNESLIWDKILLDLGEIIQKNPSSGEYTLTNKGTKPITIIDVRASCGCTVPSFPKEPIKPGEKGVIKLKYDANVIGVFSKTATVKFSDGTQQILIIKGEVIRPA